MKKFLSTILAILFLTAFSSGVAHAEVPEDFNSMKSGNTWIELEEANTAIFGDSTIVAVPKGVLKPEDTAIGKKYKNEIKDTPVYFSYSTGIYSDDGKPALSPFLKMLKEYKPENPTVYDHAVPMTDNPMFYGDLSYNNETISKDVKISAGDSLSSLKLTLSNMNWLSQPIFSELSAHDMYIHEKNDGTLRFLTDSQLVYTIKFPKGFDISKATTTSDASPDLLTLSTSVSGDVKTGMTLIVTLRRNGAGEKLLTEEQFKNELDSLNTISVSMKDIAITKDAVEGKNVVTGSIGGFLEYMNIGYDNANKKINAYTWTYVHYFAAPQEASGKDSNLAANDSQYKIQYTFNVVKPAQSTVTFKDGDKTHATVKVETGKAIDTDALTNESMPKKPTKAGYTFKEWNTKEDGKGETFTGASIVNGDMTVYAIYTKDPVPNPDPTPNPPAPTPTPSPNPEPNPTPNQPASELKLQPQTPAPQPQPEKHIGMIPKTGESASFAGLLAVLGFSIAGLALLLKKKMMKKQ
ncbi:repeat protein [Gardnerella vaginalis 409-05]|uniref:InlB B-repeat-containing protein n=1 Tax=Gardnerella sp. KA01001 TaxID=2749081 RepID=UPI0001C218B5|nr:repeat protein [Gardnerella vaginalis 409-05]